jgi:trans-2,3-dihydro-3-hydroxyanthranilate isomerase
LKSPPLPAHDVAAVRRGALPIMRHPYYVVDVFAEQPYAGNPLAVVLGTDGLDDDAMQRIAAETNYSETTFVAPTPEADGGWRVRIFTPAREIAFAGHPILGTAWAIRRHLGLAGGRPVQLNLAVGAVPVSFETTAADGEVAWFRAPPVTLGATCARAAMAAALGLAEADIVADHPVQCCSAGVSAMLVPLVGLDALGRARLDLDAHAPLAAGGLPRLTYLFCRETRRPGNDLCARFFFEAHGVREDPATGNAAAFLGAYLLQHRVFGGGDLDLRIEQGHELRRPSLVRLRARRGPAGDEILVGGGVVATLRGELL